MAPRRRPPRSARPARPTASPSPAFSATAGDRIRVRAVSTSVTLVPLATLVRPSGNVRCAAGAQFTCTLLDTGTGAIFVDDQTGTGTGGFALAVQRLNNPSGCTVLA